MAVPIVGVATLIGMLLLAEYAASKICTMGPYMEQSGSPGAPVPQGTAFDCPRSSDPRDYSECCEEGQCCPPERHFYEIDNTLAIAITVSVTLICAIIAVVIIVCCFWSKCPLYSVCTTHYNPQGEIVYGKEGENLNMTVMPAESPDKKNNFECPKQTLHDKGSAV